MSKLEKLALLAAITSLMAEDEVIGNDLIVLNDKVWSMATKEQRPEDFYIKAKEYERKVEREWS